MRRAIMVPSCSSSLAKHNDLATWMIAEAARRRIIDDDLDALLRLGGEDPSLVEIDIARDLQDHEQRSHKSDGGVVVVGRRRQCAALAAGLGGIGKLTPGAGGVARLSRPA
jgi:hypothetical protein